MSSQGFDRDDPLLRPLTIKQAMELTGRSDRTIDRWIQQGRLRKVRLGGNPPEDVVIERELLEVERATRQAARRGRPRPKSGDTPSVGEEIDAGS
jgi:excisionase family DNA binding protein